MAVKNDGFLFESSNNWGEYENSNPLVEEEYLEFVAALKRVELENENLKQLLEKYMKDS